MAIKDLIGCGIGFAPGSGVFIVTRGMSVGSDPLPEPAGPCEYAVAEAICRYSTQQTTCMYAVGSMLLQYGVPER